MRPADAACDPYCRRRCGPDTAATTAGADAAADATATTAHPIVVVPRRRVLRQHEHLCQLSVAQQ